MGPAGRLFPPPGPDHGLCHCHRARYRQANGAAGRGRPVAGEGQHKVAGSRDDKRRMTLSRVVGWLLKRMLLRPKVRMLTWPQLCAGAAASRERFEALIAGET